MATILLGINNASDGALNMAIAFVVIVPIVLICLLAIAIKQNGKRP